MMFYSVACIEEHLSFLHLFFFHTFACILYFPSLGLLICFIFDNKLISFNDCLFEFPFHLLKKVLCEVYSSNTDL